MALYVAMMVSLCCPQVLVLSVLMILLRFCALLTMFLVCDEKEPCMLSIVTPRILGVCVSGSSVLLMVT